MTIKEYLEEFYKSYIRVGKVEDKPKKVERYINGFRFKIQFEMNLFSPSSIEEVYQFSLKVEEKLVTKSEGKSSRTFRG